MKHIAVFAGASAPDTYLELAHNVGKILAEAGYVVITGGGPGMMRAVNRGAFEAKGESWGICIKHRAEEIIPDFFTKHETYDRFDERNDKLLSLGDAFVVLPGGIGTIVEALQITQRKKFREISPFTPLLLVGQYYEELTHVFGKMQEEGFISDALEDLYQYVQSIEEMIAVLEKYFSVQGENKEPLQVKGEPAAPIYNQINLEKQKIL